MTTALAAAFLAAACSSPSVVPVEASPSAKPPSVEQTQTPIRFVNDMLARLEPDNAVEKDQKSIDLSSIQKQYKPEDYQRVLNAEGREVGRGDSAPVLEISYDHQSKKFEFVDQTPQGLGNTELYNLLKPLQDNVVIQTAFTTDKLDRIIIRQNEKNEDPELKVIDKLWGTINTDQKGKGADAYVFLPGTGVVNNINYRGALLNETLHTYLADSPLSPYTQEMPSSTEVAQWREVCVPIRNIALKQAEQYKQGLSQTMRDGSSLFTDPQVREVFNEIEQAIRSGAFEKYQPRDSESDLQLKVPGCETLGPWEAFRYLLKKKDISFDASTDRHIIDLSTEIGEQWAEVIGNRTIFEFLREGTYDEYEGGDKEAGHPYTVTEIITSHVTMILLYPELLGTTLNNKGLSPSEKKAAVALIDKSVKSFDAKVPQDQMEFHINLRTQYELFKLELNK